MSATQNYSIMGFLNAATCNLFDQYTLEEIDCYVDDQTLLEADYGCKPTQIEGSESVCGDLSAKAVFNNMIERLLFEHVEKVHAYRVERNLVSFHELAEHDQEKAYGLWLKNCVSKAVLDKTRACFNEAMQDHWVALTDDFLKNVGNIFAVKPTDFTARTTKGYKANEKFLADAIHYSFNVNTGEIYKHG